jgi:hypothetical protein
MPTRSEVHLLDAEGDRIQGAVCLDGTALFLARTTWNGSRRLHFRVRDPESTNAVLQRIVALGGERRPWDYKMWRDPGWEQATWFFSPGCRLTLRCSGRPRRSLRSLSRPPLNARDWSSPDLDTLERAIAGVEPNGPLARGSTPVSLARREGHDVYEEPSDNRVDLRLVGLEGGAGRGGRGGVEHVRVRPRDRLSPSHSQVLRFRRAATVYLVTLERGVIWTPPAAKGSGTPVSLSGCIRRE